MKISKMEFLNDGEMKSKLLEYFVYLAQIPQAQITLK